MEKIKNRIDVRFLTETLAIQTYSKDDSKMLTYIKDALSQINVTVEEDGYGNIYVTKGIVNDYPCLVAHVDTVHPIVEEFSIHKVNDTLFAFDNKKGKQCGIGGDDKVGVYILLQALLDIPVLKAVFFRDEEIGCLGAAYSALNHKDWFNNCNYIVEVDRRDCADLITNSGGLEITSDAFKKDIKEIVDTYGYKEAFGIWTDIDRLVAHGIGISCMNISCGYINPHSSSETVLISGVNAAYNLVYDIFTKLTHKKYEHVPPPRPVYKYKKNQGYYHQLFESKKKHGNEQLELWGPLENKDLSKYGSAITFDYFAFTGETKEKVKLYRYIGIKAIPFSTEIACTSCKDFRTLYYLPYEGRIFCTKCNDYADNEEDLDLFKYLEVDDNDVTFVFSVFADAWLDKSVSVWDEELKCWVPDKMPF